MLRLLLYEICSQILLLFFSHLVVSDSLKPHGLQHVRLLCSPVSPRVCSNSCPLSRWCYLTISSSPTPFPFCFHSFPGSESFFNELALHIRQPKIGASASVLPKNIQGWSPLELTGLISLQFKAPSIVFSRTTMQKQQFFAAQLFLWSNSHIGTWLPEKPVLTIQTFVSKVIYLLFNTLSPKYYLLL